MANSKKFNVRHGLSSGSGSTLKDIIQSDGTVIDVGVLTDLQTVAKNNTVAAINELRQSLGLIEGLSETSEPMGVLDRQDSQISFDDATKTFSISLKVPATEFIIWTKGTRRVYTSTQTVSIGTLPSTGLYYIYFDGSGVLQYKTIYFDWENDTPIAYVYWNASTSKAEFIADERHGIVLDWATHEYLHRTRGAVIAEGFSISNYTTTGDGSADSDVTIDIGNGTFFDEDLEVSITHNATPTIGEFNQILTGDAEIPIFYQNGTLGSWVRDNPTTFPVKYSPGGRIQYNQLSGGNWTTTEISSNKYGIVFIVATNEIRAPIIAILGQNEFTNLDNAKDIDFSSLALPGFPIVEFRPLYRLIYQTSNSYTNSTKSRLVDVADIRSLSPSPVGTPINDHGTLIGLADDDHTQYVHTSLDRTISASHTISGNTRFTGGIKDLNDNLGTSGQNLVSTGAGVEWKFPTPTTNVIYVSKDGNDSNNGGSLQNSKLTIKSALSSASAGTVIKISAGTYSEDNPLIIPPQVSIVGDSLREVTVTPQNNGDLFYVSNGDYISDMSFTGASNTGAIFSFNPSDPPYISQSPYIQNCTNFVPGSQGLRIDGDHCIGPFKSMVVDSYTQYNQGGIGAQIKNEAYAQLVSMFTICCDTAIKCENGGGCDLTNSNSSFGNYGLVSNGLSALKYTGDVVSSTIVDTNIVRIDISSSQLNVSSASYNETTGILTIQTSTNHNLQVGMDVEIRDLIFTCTSGGSTSSQAFPSGANGYIFSVKTAPTTTQFTVNVGTSDIVHTYASGGTIEAYKIRPFDGQAVYFNNLTYEVYKINISNGGSGYTSVPTVTIGGATETWGIDAQAIAEIFNGEVVAIEIISSGRGYSSTPPSITIDPPTSGTQATASVQLTPTYYLVQESTEISTGIYDVVFKDNIPFSLSVNDTSYFYKQSRLLASGHSFEYIGSGTNINTALPRNGGVPIQENETVSENGGIVIYTSTDHSGSFRIGNGVIIDQTLGRISGQSYAQSLFSTVTPFILALGGN